MKRLALLAALAASPASAQGLCVDVRIGATADYACVNQALARLADAAHGPAFSPATIGVATPTSPAPAVGSFSQAATAERMGSAFGRSVVAQRPPPPVYPAPLLGRP